MGKFNKRQILGKGGSFREYAYKFIEYIDCTYRMYMYVDKTGNENNII